ncbi:hypothetical protein [Bacillus sp. FSL R7-0685]
MAIFARNNAELVALYNWLDFRKVIAQYGRHFGAVNRKHIPF